MIDEAFFHPEYEGALEQYNRLKENRASSVGLEDLLASDLLRREWMLHDVHDFLSDWLFPNSAQNEGDMANLLTEIENVLHNRPVEVSNETMDKD